ncbi:MAG: GIY-YIG nuclease family protein [Aeromicrobium sp.]
MLIGACGLNWDATVYEWNKSAGRRILGQRSVGRGKVEVADFSGSRCIYVLYKGADIYYVGLSTSYGLLSGRLSDHLKDRHAELWDQFSWFSFDAPSEEVDEDGVLILDDDWDFYDKLTANEAIKDLEAILIALLAPSGNRRNEKFAAGEKWTQVIKP